MCLSERVVSIIHGMCFRVCVFFSSFFALFFHSSSLTPHNTIHLPQHGSPLLSCIQVCRSDEGAMSVFRPAEPRRGSRIEPQCRCCYVSFKFYTTSPGRRAANVFISHLLRCLPRRGRRAGLRKLWVTGGLTL